MEPPDGYTYTIVGDECLIEHKRTGMGCLNLFLGVWLSGWTVGCAALVHGYFNGGKMKGGDPISLWFVLAFVIPWFLVGYVLLYSIFARKTFRLTTDTMQIETRLLFLRWSISLPRDTISEIKQIKDGGDDDDSFPSWGLRLRAASLVDSPLRRLAEINHFGRNNRMRTILSRLPYEHSQWMATILSEWSGIPAEFCSEPETEP